MRYIVFGAGAVGCAIGGLLADSGRDVTLVARGDHLAALRTDGLRLATSDRAMHLSVDVACTIEDAAPEPDDVVILAMKSQDTRAAVDDLAIVAAPGSAVVCAQNGVANERTVLRRGFATYGMCVVVPATYLEAGAVSIHIGPVSGLLDVGRYPAGVDDMVTMVTTHLCHATFDSRPEPRIMRWKYAKLLNNLGNALDATCGHAAFMHSDLLSRVRTEAETCFAAAGIDYADRQEERARRATLPPMTAVAGMESPGSSTWQSLARGAGSVETDWLTGEVVLIGQLYGVPTPLNEALRRLANRMVRDGLPAGSLTVDQVEDEAERIVGAAS